MTDAPFVLLVDDDESFLEIVSRTLQRKAFRVETARGAEEGLRKAAALRPDIALSDILMPPGPTGWEFALALRGNPETRTIRVAFLTSLGDPWREFEHYRGSIGDDVKMFDKCGDLDMLGDHLLSLVRTS